MIPPDLEEILITLGAQASLLLRAATQRQQLEQSYNELAILHDIQQEISSTVDYAKVLKIVVDRLRSLFDAAEVTIRLVEEHGDQRVLRIAATTGRLFPGQPTVPMDQAQVDQKVMGGSILYIPDVRSDPDFADRDRATTNQIVSMITAPLIARRRVIGTIRVYMGERREFDFGERRILQAVAGMAATAIEHARLYRQVERNHRDLQESYRRLHTTQRELIKKDRLAILGEMAATVAHEVRNPLTSVRGFTQRILRRATSIQDEKIGEYSRIIIEEVDRLNGLMKDVLDYGRERRPVFSSTDFNQTIQEALALLQGELESHQIAVLLELNPTLGKLPHDASMIRIVMMNLIQNAIQAMPEGGGLMILTGSRKDHVRLRVADTGPGITREKLQKIWTPFYTTKLHGSGLGLPVVMKAIDAHHGRIIVRSKLGRGTIFDISIPYQQNLREIEDMGAMVGNNEAHSGS
jgi:signal transduction histidine kinase